MAANSKRESIILNIVDTVENISGVNTVQRIRPFFNERDMLIELDDSNLPLVAVVGLLPVPIPKESKMVDSAYIFFTSELTINITVYIAATSNYDSQISSLVDDFWVALHSDLRRGGYALMTRIEPDMDITLVHPYVVFTMQTIVTYQHETDGI